MFAMQYDITLPADYDMGIVRQRVASKGAFTDRFPGLGLKAYLIRERGRDGSPVNQYAPFYLWAKEEGMGRFLWGDGFLGLRQSFGRPEVKHWMGLDYLSGPAHGVTPRGATRWTETLPPDAELSDAIRTARQRAAQRSREPGVFGTAVALDPRHWEFVHFTLWERIPAQAEGTRYEVLHLSAPRVNDLAVAGWLQAG